MIVVWARDTQSNQINAFIVRKGSKGLTTTKIENKIALRCVQNADITLDDVFVPDSDKLPGVQSFKDTNKILVRGVGSLSHVEQQSICGAGHFAYHGGVAACGARNGRVRHGVSLRAAARAVWCCHCELPNHSGEDAAHAGTIAYLLV